MTDESEEAKPRTRFPLSWRMASGILIFAAVAGFILYPRMSRRTGAAAPFGAMDIARLTTSGRITHAAISPDGKYVAQVLKEGERNSLWVKHVDAPSNVRIAGPAVTEIISVAFTPDGKSIYYIALDYDKGDTTAYRVPVLGGPSDAAVDDIGPVGFSPDGKQISFMRMQRTDSTLVVADADGSNQRVVATRHKPDYFDMRWTAPAWSPDGETIACPISVNDPRGRHESLVSVNPADGKLTPLTSMRWSYVGQPVWLRDGSGLLLTASDRPGSPIQIWNIELPGGRAERITRDLVDYYELSLTRDGSRLAAVQASGESTIWVAPSSDLSRPKRIGSEVGYLEALAWTPDGQIVYRSRAGGEQADIWKMKGDGSGAKQVTVGANVSRGLAVAPDGRHFVFVSTRSGRFNLWRVDDDGGNLRQLTAGDGEFYPHCSPDGKWVVYQSGEVDPRVWKVPLDGGQPVSLSPTRATKPIVSPDGKKVAYSYLDMENSPPRWRVGVISSEGGPLLNRFDFPSTVQNRMIRWSPDGKAIAFVNQAGGTSDIWLQSLDGGPPRQVTHFRADEIPAFGWSPDGRDLVCTCAVETSDVVLIERK